QLVSKSPRIINLMEDTFLLSTQDEDCSENVETLKIVDDRYLMSLSPFECLTRELVFVIIEFVPESVRELMQTCRVLRSHVYEFARQRQTIPLVDQLSVQLERSHDAVRSLSRISITVIVSSRKANLFELRLHLRYYPPPLHSRIQRVATSKYNTTKQYYLFLETCPTSARYRHVLAWECLVASIGTRVYKVHMDDMRQHEYGNAFEWNDGLGSNCAWNLLDNFQIHHLSVMAKKIGCNATAAILKTLETRCVEQLTLSSSNVP
ncbi:hypothetical protein PMAYCL1PPCAC_20949, partial [Pristionchus mayeri]